MKKLLIFTILSLLIQTCVSSQSCLPDGITFSSQAKIDSFQTNYPNCTEIEGKVIIIGAHNITNLNGLSALTSIDGGLEITFNYKLTSLMGLENLNSIGGLLWVYENNALTSLTSLDNLEYIGGDLFIGANELLSKCEIQSICEYLINPNGTIIISGNATGCNTQIEVENACMAVGVDNLLVQSSFSIYPNPTDGMVYIESENTVVDITVFNTFGQTIPISAVSGTKFMVSDYVGKCIVRLTDSSGVSHYSKLMIY